MNGETAAAAAETEGVMEAVTEGAIWLWRGPAFGMGAAFGLLALVFAVALIQVLSERRRAQSWLQREVERLRSEVAKVEGKVRAEQSAGADTKRVQ